VYDIALSVAACARSGTRADVAWMVAPSASNAALALTPGGGRIGSLAAGAFDGLLADAAARQLPTGRLVEHAVNPVESALCGLPVGTPVAFLVVPADQVPVGAWQRLLDHEPVTLVAQLSDGEVTAIDLDADAPGRDPAVQREGAAISSTFAPIPRLVVAGQGPIAEALAAQGALLGWTVSLESRPDIVAGLTASLSWLDAVVVLGHDVESSSRCLMAALESDAGYIGAVGSHRMQESRADWLAYRDVTDLSRVHGPAGLEIGAASPAEIAVSIAAQVIVSRSG